MQTLLRHELEELLSRKEALLAQAQSECDSLQHSCNAIRNTLDFIDQGEMGFQNSRI